MLRGVSHDYEYIVGRLAKATFISCFDTSVVQMSNTVTKPNLDNNKQIDLNH